MHEMFSSQLAARCRNARPDASHEPFCFELFRRAIAECCSLCWCYLRNQYYPLVRYWVSRRTSTDPDAIDDLTQDTFTAFSRFYTADKLARAKGLGDVLAFLKACAATAVVQAYRKKKRRPPEVTWDERIVDAHVSALSAEESAAQQMIVQQIWAAIEARCNDELECLVARATFLYDLKPGRIAEQFPDLFSDVSEAYRIKRNLIGRLRRDPILQAICKK